MQTANILLGLGGDRRTSVPKYGVTAAEVAVLRLVHGDEAVYDIELTGEVQRTHRQEIARLAEIYGRREGERFVSPAVSELYPGAAARVFENFAELELPEELFAVERRRTAHPLDHDADGKKGGSKPKAVREAQGLDGMTLNELRAHASKHPGLDINGLTKKADLLEAIKLYEASRPVEPETFEDADEGDGTGELNDEFSDGVMG